VQQGAAKIYKCGTITWKAASPPCPRNLLLITSKVLRRWLIGQHGSRERHGEEGEDGSFAREILCN